MSRGDQQEVVMLYDSDAVVCEEMHFTSFEALLAGNQTLDEYAASLVRAAYCVIGNGLSLRGAVFFLFEVDEEGRVDKTFNLPLRYLVQQAGIGEDLGQGGIRQASRGQCSVPWHSVNLWEPAGKQGIEQLQSRVFRNKLRLKNATNCRDADFFPQIGRTVELREDEASASLNYTLDGNLPNPYAADDDKQTQPDNHALAAKLTEVFGEAGKLSLQELIRMHADQLDNAKARYRNDVETQQTGYLDQIRNAREEIHALKVELRREQGHNRRLQQMLRGDL